MNATEHLRIFTGLGLTPIPLKPRSKEPLVRGKEGDWEPTEYQLLTLAERDNINWGVRCGRELAVLDIDSVDRFENVLKTLPIPPNCPVVKTGRGGHIWFKPKRPMPSQRVDGLEIKGTGAYVVAPPSVHPNGEPYTFVVAPEGPIPEIDTDRRLAVAAYDFGEFVQEPSLLLLCCPKISPSHCLGIFSYAASCHAPPFG